jgi:hypothetical protein
MIMCLSSITPRAMVDNDVLRFMNGKTNAAIERLF